jgi:hypothetical protein
VAITNKTSLSAAVAARQVLNFLYGFNGPSLSSWNLGSPFSLWGCGCAQWPPAGNTNPAGAIPTSMTTGALFPLVDAGAGKQLYLGKMRARQAYSYTSLPTPIPVRIVLRLYDRLYHAALPFVGASQTITLNGATVTRGPASGIGNEIWLELYTAVASGSVTVTYVNQSGGTSTTPAVALNLLYSDGSNGRAQQFLLAAGDTGVQSIVSVTSATLPTYPSNTHQEMITILHEVAHYTYNFTEGEFLDALDLGLPTIDNGSCLFFMTEACIATASYPWGIMGRIEIYQQ